MKHLRCQLIPASETNLPFEIKLPFLTSFHVLKGLASKLLHFSVLQGEPCMTSAIYRPQNCGTDYSEEQLGILPPSCPTSTMLQILSLQDHLLTGQGMTCFLGRLRAMALKVYDPRIWYQDWGKV